MADCESEFGRLRAQEAAERYVRESFPDCLVAVLGGSAGNGKSDLCSDLDIVILEKQAAGPNHQVVQAYGWVIECFILHPETYRDSFDEGIRAANPALQRIVTEGIALRCEAEGAFLFDEARADLAYGPMIWSDFELDYARYRISDYLTDLRGADKRGERWMVAGKLVELLCEFALRASRQWIAEGKHLFRLFEAHDAAAALQLERAMEALYRFDDPRPLVWFGTRLLEPYGGILLDGYEN